MSNIIELRTNNKKLSDQGTVVALSEALMGMDRAVESIERLRESLDKRVLLGKLNRIRDKVAGKLHVVKITLERGE